MYILYIHVNVPVHVTVYMSIHVSCALHLQWLQEDFLAYLRDWEESVSQRTEYTVKEKGKMLLSAETRYGIEVTGENYIGTCSYIHVYL